MKTDNHSLRQKIDLRREVCALLGRPLKVLDLFAGEGRVWWGMKEFCEIESYTPVDQKPRMSGVIKMTVSARTVRGFDLSQYNVVDVDCYGEPWEVWRELAKMITGETAVFLTNGHVSRQSTMISKFLRAASGIPIEWNIPKDTSLARRLGRDFLLSSLQPFRVTKALYIEHTRVTYYGLLLTKKIGLTS
jgi:hypothetical protein